MELLYRALKQTLERRKMLSDSPQRAEVELDWTLVGLWLLGLIGLQAIQQNGWCPQQASVAATLRVLQRAIDKGPANYRQQGLQEDLGRCIRDRYVRRSSKQSRHRKNKKTERPPGAPKLRMADLSEVQLAQRLREERPAA